MTVASLVIGGREVPWKEIAVERSLESMVGTVRATVPLAPGAPTAVGARTFARVASDEDTGARAEQLVNGFLDGVAVRSNAQAQEVSLTIRDRTADLVDGSRIESPGQWGQLTLDELARAIAQPYGIGVDDYVGASGMRILGAASEPGETDYEVIERIARRFGVLVGTSPSGRLTLGSDSLGRAEVGLRSGQGGNIKAWSWSASVGQRFRRTRVIGGNDGGFGSVVGPAQLPIGDVEDPEVRDQRERVIIAQGQVTALDCSRLAAWHASVARARAATLEVELPSWRQGRGGSVWRPGLTVDVELVEIDDRARLLVQSVSLRNGRSGEVATLRLVRSDSLERNPNEGLAKDAGGFGVLVG